MARFGKPDATGRSSGKHTGRLKKVLSPPKGEPWVWLTSELLSSDAWRAQSVNCRKLLDFLIVEHANHAGLENGNLKAPYDHLVEYGLTRSQIRAATEEADFLGLLRVKRGGRYAGNNQPSVYRLTFLPCANEAEAPTNEWLSKTGVVIAEWRRDQGARKAIRRRKHKRNKAVRENLNPGSQSDTTVVPLYELPIARIPKCGN